MRIGTRGSALALAQAGWVAQRLAAGSRAGGQVELVEVTTAGDRGQGVGDKSRWVSALERALLDGQIDLAVHSAKDVPGELASGTCVAGIPAREDPGDVLCGASSLANVPIGSRVGTSSVRRAAQLLSIREDLQIVELRGNVDTRLRKLAAREADAIILAAAGLSRLGRLGEAGCALSELIPAPGQGALLLQTRGDDPAIAAVRVLSEPDAEASVLAERAFARALGASCATPLGARATPAPGQDGPKVLTLKGWIGLPDGSEWIADELTADAARVGQELAERMLAVGARELLHRAEAMA